MANLWKTPPAQHLFIPLCLLASIFPLSFFISLSLPRCSSLFLSPIYLSLYFLSLSGSIIFPITLSLLLFLLHHNDSTNCPETSNQKPFNTHSSGFYLLGCCQLFGYQISDFPCLCHTSRHEHVILSRVFLFHQQQSFVMFFPIKRFLVFSFSPAGVRLVLIAAGLLAVWLFCPGNHFL